MKKARSLREALIKAVPQLETNPEMMRIFADEGNIDARPRCRMRKFTP